MHVSDRQDIEIALLIEALRRRHGYDFSGYTSASFKRRVLALMDAEREPSISRVVERVIHEPTFLHTVLARLSVPVSEMFRDPEVFSALRSEVLPRLASYSRINIWQAGCAHGEEVYSLAILLEECGLLARSHIFATDISDAALAKAQEGIYRAEALREYTENYRRAGGTRSLDDYLTVRYDYLKINDTLRANITFANHNLVADGVFGEMNLILCRNVLIYFSRPLQERVLRLFRDSLVRGGYLCLGTKESLQHTPLAADLAQLQPNLPIYRLRPHAA